MPTTAGKQFTLVYKTRENGYIYRDNHHGGRFCFADHSGDGWYDTPQGPEYCDDGPCYFDVERLRQLGGFIVGKYEPGFSIFDNPFDHPGFPNRMKLKKPGLYVPVQTYNDKRGNGKPKSGWTSITWNMGEWLMKQPEFVGVDKFLLAIGDQVQQVVPADGRPAGSLPLDHDNDCLCDECDPTDG